MAIVIFWQWKGAQMSVQQLSLTRRNYVVALARNREHAEAVAMNLAYQGLPVACLEVPTNADLCVLCGPMHKAQKIAFVMGALTATASWIVFIVALAIVQQLL